MNDANDSNKAVGEGNAPVAASIDVCIVTYNCPSLLKRSIESVLDQRDVHVTIYVADNGEDLETPSLLNRCFPSVIHAARHGNRGFGAQCNALFRRSSSEYVLFLNPDTRLIDPFTLRDSIEQIRQRRAIGVLSPKLVMEHGEVDRACRRGEPTPWRVFCYLTGLSRVAEKNRYLAGYHLGHLPYSASYPVDAVNGAFMLAERSLLEAVGGPFDERYWMYMEDLDLCRRIRNTGREVYYWADREVEHIKGGTDPGRTSAKTRVAFTESAAIYYSKWYAWYRLDASILRAGLRARVWWLRWVTRK